jgi:hypothetical protein
MPHPLDAPINAAMRELDAMKARGDGGEFVPGKGYVGTTPEYTALLYRLRDMTRQRVAGVIA